MRVVRRLLVLAGLAVAAKWAYDRYVAPARRPMGATGSMRADVVVPGDEVAAAGSQPVDPAAGAGVRREPEVRSG